MTHAKSTALFINGAKGRMGARIIDLAQRDARFRVAAAHDLDDLNSADRLPVGTFDVIIDFSSDEGALHAAQLAVKHRAALLVGTTGLSSKSLDAIESAARAAAVVVAPNTSLGVAVMTHLAIEAARLLGSEFNVDLIDFHHAAKRDAPSGTALRLAAAIRDRAAVNLDTSRIHSIRAGEIIGEHQLHFAGPGETLTITHSATSRDLFARGALRCAAWLHGKPHGRYTIEQTLGLQ
jgi:4-hydroxy-tetrahydrodipicolinate reductase